MDILEHRALRGPNFYARFPVTYMKLDIGALEDSPSDEIPGLPQRIKEALPSLHAHRCSPGVPGGFFQRLDRGTWAGHIVEHIALELQNLAGMDVGFGKTRETTERGIYSVVYKHLDEHCGLRAGEMAVRLLQDLIDGNTTDIEALVQELRELRERGLLGPSTGSIVREAESRGIPWMRMNSQSHIMFGQGHKQRAIQASMTNQTTALGVAIAADKSWTKRLLDEAGIAVPKGRPVADADEAVRVAEKLGFPVVVKPLDANHGRGITTDIHSADEVRTAYDAAHEHHDTVIVERFLVGRDHRLLVVGGRLVSAARRDPAHVVGDGKQSIQQLIDATNADPRRGFGHEKVLTMIHIDGNTKRMLAVQGLTLDSVPNNGQEVVLKSTANLSTGGTATDVTDDVHPSIVAMARRVAGMVGLDIMGIDVVAPHLRAPLTETGGGIVEVNAGPGLRMHLEPTHGQPRNVAADIVDMLWAGEETDGRVPTVAVTGTNGKTTTVRLISHMMKMAGHRVGLACTGFVEIENQVVDRGDYSGPVAAQMVLRDPRVTAAAIEVARGGILRRGLGVDRLDVGVLLNVGRDHIGEGDIHDLEDLTRLKGTVPDAAATAVLNADDELVLGLRHNKGFRDKRIIPFSLDSAHPFLAKHLAADSENVVVTQEDGAIVLKRGRAAFRVAEVRDVPITMAGNAQFNVANCLAAVAAAYAIGIPEEAARTALQTFDSSFTQNPGRLNVFDMGETRVLLDFAHNVPALEALDQVLPHLKPRPDGRILRVGYLAGNRLDGDLQQVGVAMAKMADYLWISDPDPRGREEGATSQVIAQGALTVLPADRVTCHVDEWDCINAMFEAAQPGDLLIFQGEDHKGFVARVRELQAEVDAERDAEAGRKEVLA